MQTSQEQIAHLLWCLLVAVRTAVENHEITSETSKRKFIAQWLRGARRHDAFRGMASEFQTLRLLLEKELSHPIEGTLNTLWMNAMSSTRCDLFRFRAVLGSLAHQGWRHALCPWPEQVVTELMDRQKNASNHILQLTRMEEAFSPTGAMTAPVTLQLLLKKNDHEQVENAFHNDQFSIVRAHREITLHKATVRTLYIGHARLPDTVWCNPDDGRARWHPAGH